MGDAGDVFALHAAARRAGPVIWIADSGAISSLAPTGVQDLIDPVRIIAAACVSRTEALWAGEQALRTQGVGAVVIELDGGPDLQTSRRLQIAAEEGGGLGVVLVSGRAQTSAAQTRWFCSACADPDAKWVWELVKNKSGRIGAWRVAVSGENGGDGDAPGLVLMAAATAA